MPPTTLSSSAHDGHPTNAPTHTHPMSTPLRKSTIAVIGGSYVGLRLATSLAKLVPSTHRVLVVESNSHFHHLFTFPRFSVLHRGGEEKAFVPYTYAFDEPGIAVGAAEVVRARALAIHPSTSRTHGGGTIQLDRPVRLERGAGQATTQLEYDVVALATGTELSRPWCLSTASHGAPHSDGEEHGKKQDVQQLQQMQDQVRVAKRIVVVGGGAVGVQVALDIAQLYPRAQTGKEVVVVHSRERLMNKYHADLHALVSRRMADEGIEVHLSSRLVLPSSPPPTFRAGEMQTLPLSSGGSVTGDLYLFCTGQTPRSSLIAALSPSSLTESGFVRVLPTLQLDSRELEPHHARCIFAIGDVAHTGATKTVRAAMPQIQVVTQNVLQLLGNEEAKHVFEPSKTVGIHLTLGLTESVKFGNPPTPSDPPRCLVEADGALDMNATRTWSNLHVPTGTDYHL
ncbi:hypothetical protein ACQY0O_003349 [Thecaphora frezii]